jgi:hypothetical protein
MRLARGRIVVGPALGGLSSISDCSLSIANIPRFPSLPYRRESWRGIMVSKETFTSGRFRTDHLMG